MSRRRWTAADLPDQSGRTAIVTGANSGLGFVSARELARAGARVVLACRDLGRGEAAAERIHSEASLAEVELEHLDLADLGSVRAFAERVATAYDGLDTLVNNAGVMAIPRRETTDGFEMQLGINHLGHFALTGLLLPQLLRKDDPRVVTVSSVAHRGRIDFGDLHGERRYSRLVAYNRSKLANLLFAYGLQRRAQAAGWPLRSVAAHPGWARTNLQFAGARMDESRLEWIGMSLARAFAQSGEMGALPILYAATRPDLPGASYVGPRGPLGLRGYPKVTTSSLASQDVAAATRLWVASEELTGVGF
jgi:NAD(P)-dependent dehydrogenase (short-subunit alcohol dehydrogenase family)